MTPDQIKPLKPGPELDRAVAVKLFRLTPTMDISQPGDYAPRSIEPHSTEYANAWLRRLVAAEEAILEWAEAYEAMPDPEEGSIKQAMRQIETAQQKLLALAARIREGREKGKREWEQRKAFQLCPHHIPIEDCHEHSGEEED